MHDVTTCHPPSGRCRPHPLARLARLAAIGLGLVVLPTRPSSAAEAAGITEPFLDVTLSSPVPGIVSRQRFKEGEFVQEGQPIMELDKRLEELEETRRKLVADLRRADFEATQTLFQNSKAVSKEEVDKKLVEFKVAAVEHELAVEQLRRRLLIAPLSGTVTEYLLDVGEACEPYRPLVRVVDTRRCYFVCNLEARHGAALKPDQTVTLEIDTGTATITIPGRLVYVSPVVDPASGLLKVKALFDNPDGRIRPGLAGRMKFGT